MKRKSETGEMSNPEIRYALKTNNSDLFGSLIEKYELYDGNLSEELFKQAMLSSNDQIKIIALASYFTSERAGFMRRYMNQQEQIKKLTENKSLREILEGFLRNLLDFKTPSIESYVKRVEVMVS